ncbi:MAG: efflux RND transporter permease subunit [Legionellales bacterium]|nr:efflux RND transporter permease subunit [Legionellales bacterium]
MISYFVNNSKITFLITFAIFLAGILNLFSMKREAFPNVDFAQAVITTYYPGATPEDVEILITKKIEDALRANSGIKQLTSVSQEGFSEVKLKIDLDNVDAKQEMTEIQRSIDRITDLPEDLPNEPSFMEIKTEHMPIYEISVLGDVSQNILRKLANELEDIIELSEGVSSIEKIGYLKRELKIHIDPIKMKEKHISFNEIVQAVKLHNINSPGGIFENRPVEKSVRMNNIVDTPAKLDDIVLRTNLSGQVIKISDIGKSTSAFEKPKVITRTNGKPSIILVIRKDKNADIIKLADEIQEKVIKFTEKIPDNVKIVVSNDESRRTVNRLDIVVNNSILGFILLFFATLVFLSIRTSVVASFSVPIIILFTLSIMSWLNITFNVISMLAIVIALGMFVDNSIVITENIYRLSQEGVPMHKAAIQGTQEIYIPIIATVLTTIAAFMPMSVTTGILGQFIWAIPVIVSSSLIVSLFESFCLLPARIIKFNKNIVERKLGWFRHIQDIFVKILKKLLTNRYKTSASALIFLILILVFAFMKLDFILFPPEGVDRFIVRYSAPVGTPIKKLHSSIKKVEDYILALPSDEIVSITTRTGVQQKDPGDPLARKGDNVGMMIVYLTNENSRKRNADEIIKQLRKDLPIFEPLDRLQFDKVVNGPPVGQPVTVSIKGNDLNVLKIIAKDIQDYLKSINGVEDIDQDLKPGMKQLQITVKKDIGENYGLTPEDISFSLRTALEGIVASKVRNFDDDIDIRVLFSDQARGDQKALNKMLVSTKRGNLIPLDTVADIKEINGPETRRHYNHQRSITVTAGVDLDKTTSSSVNAKLAKKFQNISLDYPGYSLKFGGEEESSQESMISLGRAMILAIIGIFTILVAILKSYLKPFLIMFSIPFSFIGPIIGFAIHGKPFGFIAMIGFVGLTGVVVNAAIILVATIDNLRKKDNLSLEECLIKGAKIRLRPILLTTVTTILALFPTAYGIGGYDPILVPMTLAMAWGLLFGTFLTLIVVPCGYAIIEDLYNYFSKSRIVKG